ncbi:MAG TPA: DUF2520 domain-containing protein [Paludibacteraceae bacterium]|nr:DUF2520 domain-containing protein [Paludibacteraceae bacterium]HOU68589.1 DUF2520 domain-containing protein [Paludibacteraceae bacterium]HQF50419.1 DUF2520 domain-containing protein [Paludibacteraceae bacterium]HQJ89951.1 DUF2520 domain-containing protein [Paludibacteraceae bacterium]
MSDLKICIIGSGNVATQMGLALSRKWQIVEVYSRTEASASVLAGKLGCTFTTDIKNLTDDADVYICSVKDSVLGDLLPQKNFKGKILLHTAGSLPMSVLANYTDNIGVLYPLQSISKARELDFSKVPLLVEASNEKTLSVLKTIANGISNSVYDVTSEERGMVHLAAVFASNFTNHMYDIAGSLLADSNLPFDLLLPIIDETASKVHLMPPSKAQTGPAIRYDRNVIDKHLNMITDERMKKIYELVTEDIHESLKDKK